MELNNLIQNQMNMNNIQQVNTPTQEQKNQQKKRRAISRRACENCRKAHSCCTDFRPCKRCISLEISCVDTPSKKRGRKRKFNTNGEESSDKNQKTQVMVQTSEKQILINKPPLKTVLPRAMPTTGKFKI
jgi:hypothetical protein